MSYYSDASSVMGSANLGMQPTAFGRGSGGALEEEGRKVTKQRKGKA